MHKNIVDIKDVKNNNIQKVLDCIRIEEQISRVDVARRTNLTKCTISSLVNELIEKKLIEEIGLGEASKTGGRKPILLRISPNNHYAIGIQISDNRFIKGYLCNLEGKIIEHISTKYSNQFIDIVKDILYIVDNLRKKLPQNAKLLGIGIGVAGIVDVNKQRIIKSVNYDVVVNDLREEISDISGLYVVIENESNAAALAEKNFGAGQSNSNFVYVSIGKGLGSGIVIGRELYYGENFSAGEIGHIKVNPFGTLCNCGSKGCLETEVSQKAILSKANTLLGKETELDEIYELYVQGHTSIKVMIEDSARLLGNCLSMVYGVLNINKFIIGGSLDFGDEYINIISETLKSRIIHGSEKNIQVISGNLGDEAVGLGGIALVFELVWKYKI